MYFEIYISDGYRWRLRAANHEIIAMGENYKHYRDCMHAIELLQGTTPDTPVRFVVTRAEWESAKAAYVTA